MSDLKKITRSEKVGFGCLMIVFVISFAWLMGVMIVAGIVIGNNIQ